MKKRKKVHAAKIAARPTVQSRIPELISNGMTHFSTPYPKTLISSGKAAPSIVVL